MSTVVKNIFSRIFLAKGLLIFFVVASVVFVPSPARAGAWGESIGAELMGQIMDTIKRQIEGAIMGTLKIAATEILNSKVGQMIGGSSSSKALFITDWNNYLYETPAQQARLYMNDFFTLTTRGKYASANYVGIGDVAGNVSGNYVNYLVSNAGIPDESGASFPSLTYNLDEYTPNPQIMFQEGDFRGFNAFVSNPMNNPFGFQMVSQTAYAQELANAQELAKTKAQSSGFTGVEQNGVTIAPAATVMGISNNVQNIGNNIIAAAQNPGEFLSGVMSALVNKTISNLVQRGVGKIQASIRKEIRSVDNKIVGKLNEVDRALGPAAKFTKEVSQRTDVLVNTYAKPPPPARDGGVYCSGGC